MKAKVLLGGILMLASVSTSQAEPSPDLMNSISSIRRDAQKRLVTSEISRNDATIWSAAHNRNITAGQSVVAVPDLPRSAAAGDRKQEFNVAPLPQPNSSPGTK